MTPPPDDHEPSLIGGRYRLDERIGAGAMGAVWRGTDELLNRPVAVKELLAAAEPRTAAGGDALAEARQRILREGRIGARLQHAHVISMFDVVVHDDRPWLVMEYLPSRSLAATLAADGAMSPREAAAMGRQVADGLAAAHAAGVLHRDVKPGNVLIGEDGLVKLTDFGVSRAVDDVQLTRTGLIAGTPAYLAPEVARGQEPSAASDVFALGATLYAAVEGTPPFGLDDNAYALLHKVATGEVRPPEHAGPLTALLMRLLAADPAARPTAEQARDALAAVAAGRSAAGAGTTTTAATSTAILAAPAPPPGPPVPARQAAPRTARPAAAPPPAPRTPAEQKAGSARRRTPLLLALIVVLLAGAGFVVAAIAGDGGDGGDGPLAQQPTTVPAPPTSSAPATTSAAPTTTTASPAPTTLPSPPPTTAPEPERGGAPAPTDPVAFVQSYYALLPENTDAAWERLGPGARSASGGREGFESFYGGMESVTLQSARQTGVDTVDATVVFVEDGGATSAEPYRFVVSGGEDDPVIESFSRL